MEVIRAVVHNVIKEQHQTDAVIHRKESVFRIDQKLQVFVEELEKVYQKHGGKSYGIFERDSKQYPFQRFMNEYLQKKEDVSFYQFSIQATELFKRRLVEAQASTGGYLFFLHYRTDSNKEYLSVIVLNDKIGYAIQQDTLELVDVINLNMEHLSMGARIDFQEYHEHREESYLSFIRGTKKVRNYFTTFIGCIDYQTSRASTERTVKVLYEYCEKHKIEKEQRRNMEKAMYEFIKTNSVIDLEMLSRYLVPENAPDFHAMLQEAEISDHFDPDQNVAKHLVSFRYERNGVRIEFPKGKLDSQEILYDDKRKELRIKDIDGEIGEMIRHELG